MKEFAKIFNHKYYGQILGFMDFDYEGAPMMKVIVVYNGTMITSGMVFKDNQDGWDLLHKIFEDFDEKMAIDLAESTIEEHIERKKQKESVH